MQVSFLLQLHLSLGGKEEQGPEHPHPIGVEIGSRSFSPVLNEGFEIDPVKGRFPMAQEHAQGGGGFWQLLPVGEGGHLGNRFATTEALLPLASPQLQLIGIELFGDRFELFDQFAEGDWSTQRWWGYRAALQQAFWSTRQVEIRIQPALIPQIRFAALFQHWFRGKGLGFEHFRFQAHEHGGGQKGFAAVGQILLVAATTTVEGTRYLTGHGKSLTQLIEKAVNHGDHIHIPGIEIAALRRILKKANRQASPTLTSADQLGIRQRCDITPLKVSTGTRRCQLSSCAV